MHATDAEPFVEQECVCVCGSQGQALPSCLQQNSCFSRDHAALQLFNPMSQSSGGHLDVVRVVWNGTGGHPLFSC